MKFSERKEMMNALDPELLKGGKAPQNTAEGYFRWHVLQLLADIADSFGSMEYKYGEMLKLQLAKAGGPVRVRPGQTSETTAVPPTEKSRYGGPQ